MRVVLAGDAERDLAALYCYVIKHEGKAVADRLLDSLEQRIGSLARLPRRGNVPRELRDLGIDDFREIQAWPYRILYRILPDRVIVYGVFDGRRDMQTVLTQRLLR
ncbi:MAG: type II toxin-antitoxin system RelE/ParE family toxin [Deinococcus-Thermus bacterium]|nr:type II toxin-antitoxin system RelE/ParE family toxin [Deinococcota bacterium]